MALRNFAFFIFVSIASTLAGHAQSDAVPLTRADAVRRLSEKEASESRRVLLSGVVLGLAEPEPIGFVIIDDSASIYCHGDVADVAKLKIGDKVNLEGVTNPGGFAPFVICQKIEISGRGVVPIPPVAHISELFNGALDGQWLRLRGVVRRYAPLDRDLLPATTREGTSPKTSSTESATTHKSYLQLSDGELEIPVEANFPIDPETIVDAEVEVDGLCFNRHNNHRQFLSPSVLIPEKSNLRIIKAPEADPWHGPPRAVEDLYKFYPQNDLRHRVLVKGVVIHHWPGRSLWIQDRGSGLLIQSSSTNELAVGDVVEVLGFPIRGEYAPELINGLYKKTGHVEAPEPIEIKGPADAFSQNGKLISVVGRLSEVRTLDEGISLLIESESVPVRVTLRKSLDGPAGAKFRVGSIVRVTGICVVPPEKDKPVSGVWTPKAFQILARSGDDVAELKPPPQLTAERLVWIWGSIAAVLGLSILIVVGLTRHRLREQNARNAMATAEFKATLTERSRVAREIHDTLAQGLGAISLQLQLASAARDRADVDARLDLACKLARSNLAEARSAIWNLRLENPSPRDVAESIRNFCEGLSERADRSRIECQIRGEAKRLAPAVEENVARIIQEAIRNALRHSGAKKILVTLELGTSTLSSKIVDDGVGFDLAKIRTTAKSSFGLLGIEERAKAINARLDIKSTPGSGTIVSLFYIYKNAVAG